MELLDSIKTRRSTRSFKDTPIADSILNEMLEAIRLAPSPGNSQGYYFGVIKDKEIKEKLAKAAGEQMWIASAPVVFACCADISQDIAEQSEDDFGLIVNKLRFGNDFIKYLSEYTDRKTCMTFLENATPLIPYEHIFLTAVSHELSACYIGYLDIAKADIILNLPKHLTCLFLMPIGYADELPGEKHTKAINEIAFYDRWSE